MTLPVKSNAARAISAYENLGPRAGSRIAGGRAAGDPVSRQPASGPVAPLVSRPANPKCSLDPRVRETHPRLRDQAGSCVVAQIAQQAASDRRPILLRTEKILSRQSEQVLKSLKSGKIGAPFIEVTKSFIDQEFAYLAERNARVRAIEPLPVEHNRLLRQLRSPVPTPCSNEPHKSVQAQPSRACRETILHDIQQIESAYRDDILGIADAMVRRLECAQDFVKKLSTVRKARGATPDEKEFVRKILGLRVWIDDGNAKSELLKLLQFASEGKMMRASSRLAEPLIKKMPEPQGNDADRADAVKYILDHFPPGLFFLFARYKNKIDAGAAQRLLCKTIQSLYDNYLNHVKLAGTGNTGKSGKINHVVQGRMTTCATPFFRHAAHTFFTVETSGLSKK